MDSFFQSSESIVSAVSSIHLKDCTVSNTGLDRLLSKMPNLLRSKLGYFARVGYNYWEIDGISSIMQPLTPYCHQSLETLGICGDIAIFNQGREYCLKQFQSLKQARLDVDHFSRGQLSR